MSRYVWFIESVTPDVNPWTGEEIEVVRPLLSRGYIEDYRSAWVVENKMNRESDSAYVAYLKAVSDEPEREYTLEDGTVERYKNEPDSRHEWNKANRVTTYRMTSAHPYEWGMGSVDRKDAEPTPVIPGYIDERLDAIEKALGRQGVPVSEEFGQALLLGAYARDLEHFCG